FKNLFRRQKSDLFSPGFRCHLSGTPRPWNLAAGRDRRSAENSPQSWRRLLPASSLSHWPAFLPLPPHKQVRFSYHDKGPERDTGNPFLSKDSQAAELSQCRASFALSEKLNFPQRRSGNRYRRRVLRLRACSKSNAECRRGRWAPTPLPEFSCNRPRRRGNESRSASLQLSRGPSGREKLLPECRAGNDRRNSRAQFRPRRSLSGAAQAERVRPDEPALLPWLRADESRLWCKSSRAVRRKGELR